jgi:maleate isomerase
MTKRLGLLAPSSNTILEPETHKLLPADGSVTAHVSRLRVVTIADHATSLQQFELGKALAAAELVADAKVDLILWNGTAAGWLGFGWDRELVGAIESHTGIATTTAVIALNDELQRLDARRIGLVTPYVEPIEQRIIANYRSIGIDIVASARCDLTDNAAYGAIPPAEIANMVRKVARVGVDAVMILCTNLAGSSLAPHLAPELGVPVLDSVRVAIEHSLRRLRT